MPVLLMLAGAALGLGGLAWGRHQNKQMINSTIPFSTSPDIPQTPTQANPGGGGSSGGYPASVPTATVNTTPTGYPSSAVTSYAQAPLSVENTIAFARSPNEKEVGVGGVITGALGFPEQETIAGGISPATGEYVPPQFIGMLPGYKSYEQEIADYQAGTLYNSHPQQTSQKKR